MVSLHTTIFICVSCSLLERSTEFVTDAFSLQGGDSDSLLVDLNQFVPRQFGCDETVWDDVDPPLCVVRLTHEEVKFAVTAEVCGSYRLAKMPVGSYTANHEVSVGGSKGKGLEIYTPFEDVDRAGFACDAVSGSWGASGELVEAIAILVSKPNKAGPEAFGSLARDRGRAKAGEPAHGQSEDYAHSYWHTDAAHFAHAPLCLDDPLVAAL
jgi:hypothetical protein